MLDPQVAALLTQLGYDPALVENVVGWLVWLAAITVAAAVPTALVARARGRSVLLWVMLALSVPVLPLLIVWLLSDKTPSAGHSD